MSSPDASAYIHKTAMDKAASLEPFIHHCATIAKIPEKDVTTFIGLLRDVKVKTMQELLLVPFDTMMQYQSMSDIKEGHDLVLRHNLGKGFVWPDDTSVAHTPGSSKKKKKRGGKRRQSSEELYIRIKTDEDIANDNPLEKLVDEDGCPFPALMSSMSQTKVTELMKAVMPRVRL